MTKNKSEQLLEFINKQLTTGKVVLISTSLKTIKVDNKVLEKFNKAGFPLFKLGDDGLRIRQGKNLNLICTKTQCLVKVSAI